MPIRFEWKRAKARANERKHGLSFDEASTAFSDPLSLTIDDPDHSQDEPHDAMRPEYDFSKGVRGKDARRHAEGCNVVVLAPDVAALFPDSDAVNQALREFTTSSHEDAR